MKDAAISLGKVPEIVPGRWQRDGNNAVVMVSCECGRPIFYDGAIHSRLVVPGEGVALCRGCKRLVKVPVRLVENNC